MIDEGLERFVLKFTIPCTVVLAEEELLFAELSPPPETVLLKFKIVPFAKEAFAETFKESGFVEPPAAIELLLVKVTIEVPFACGELLTKVQPVPEKELYETPTGKTALAVICPEEAKLPIFCTFKA